MTLGERIRKARLEAQLSQRQLCGDRITRNMLSQIENGAARPSMDTLRYLAQRLDKPLSFFLDEAVPVNLTVMARARRAYASGQPEAALQALSEYREPDETFEPERRLLWKLSLLEAAQGAMEAGRELYALELLAQAGELEVSYCGTELERRRLLLLSRVSREKAPLCAALPCADEELILRAMGAMENGEWARAAAALDMVQDCRSPRWQLLRGQVFRHAGACSDAVECLLQAREAFPEETAPELEHCFRELGDYRQAYYYACLQKKE